MKDNQQLVKQEAQIAKYQQWFKKDQDKLIKDMQEEHELTEEQAKEVITNPQLWADFLGIIRKRLDIHNLKVIKKAQTQTEEALNKQRSGAAADFAKTVGILRDKTFGEPHRPAAALNFFGKSGEPITIKMDWKFKSYQQKREETLRGKTEVIEGEVEENGK